MDRMITSIIRLALLLGLIAAFTCVVVAAWFGNCKPLAAWVLLCIVAVGGFLLEVRRSTSREHKRDASKTILPMR